ncbi:MAG: hypothetical protein OXC30_05620 [Alphaproteobacteria bacterium]|nr:hypothetical protein [Alphaproteobacteria bacterium]
MHIDIVSFCAPTLMSAKNQPTLESDDSPYLPVLSKDLSVLKDTIYC